MTAIQISGLAELERELKALPRKLQRRSLTNAIRAGGRIIQQEVKARAPVKSGALKRNLLLKRGKRQFDGGLEARVIIGVQHGKVKTRGKLKGYDKKGVDPFYFRFQELGFTAVGRRKAASRSERGARKHGNRSYGRLIPGKRFLRDGLTAAGPRALEAIRSRLATELARYR